ncbi:MAG: hypothetical protein V7727_13740 [Sneathiella sp.]
MIVISACTPYKSVVYDAPHWSGIVVDAVSLEPMENVTIRHATYVNNTNSYWPKPMVKSDHRGAFHIDPIFEDRFSIRLPVSGMFFEDTILSLTSDKFAETVLIDRFMRHAEDSKVSSGYVALDPNPEVFARLPFSDTEIAVNLQNARTLFKVCETNFWAVAMEKTNTARKVLQSAGWHKIDKGEYLDPREREIILSVYQKLPAYWERARQNCRDTSYTHQRKIKDVVNKIEQEVEWIVEATSPLDGKH